MAIKSWASAASGDWLTIGDWSPSGSPGAGDDVFLTATGTAYTVTYSNSTSANNYRSLTVNSVDVTLTFLSTSARTLNITDGTTLDGTLTVTAGLITAGLAFTDIINTNTLVLNGGSIQIASLGELNLGTTVGAVGKVTIAAGGYGTVSSGQLSDTDFNVGGGTFAQSGGMIVSSGTASFAGGTDSIRGGVFRATGAISIGASQVLTMGAAGTLDATAGGVANSGTIIGQGTVDGAITGGTVIASAGRLDVASNQAAASSFKIDTASGSILELDGTDSGGSVTFGSATGGVLAFSNGTGLAAFTDTVANLGTAISNTSVSGDNFINVNSAVMIGDIKVVGGSGNQFNAGNTKFVLYTDTFDTLAVGTITLASTPAVGTFAVFAPDSVANSSLLGGTDVFLSSVCYAHGTLIGTEQGDVAVEDLTEGDLIVTLQAGQPLSKPIKWTGVRKVDIAGHPRPHTVAPVRIRAGAFGDNLPRRDLLVSPAHAIYVDGKLVPANLLINNMTIVQELATKTVTYYHVELERHGLILAEGLTSESYLDTGNRAFFSNAGLGLTLHPEFHVNAGLKVWEEEACAPLAVDAEAVAPIWRELAERAETLGYVPPRFTTTLNADVYLEANGRRLRPVAVAQGRHTFMLPAGASGIVLRSRSSAPADLDPLTGDWRPLGVAVRSMTLRHGDDHIVIPADHPALTQGWYAAEASNGDLWRWTAGNATIPVQGTAGPAMLDIEIGSTATYILTSSDRDAQPLAA
jgi:hypothetical protein